MLRSTIQLQQAAPQAGSHPPGAVIVLDRCQDCYALFFRPVVPRAPLGLEGKSCSVTPS